jgi:RimJ/RimL family protein N-acetyltransferase
MPTTARLLIEPLRHEHAEGLVAALSDESVGTYIGGPAVTTVAELHDRIDFLAQGPSPDSADSDWWNWAVTRRTDGLVLGYVQATGHGEWAEVAYVFGPSNGGHGYATEAVQWMVAHLAADGLSELWAAVHPANERSVRLLVRVGFRPVLEPSRVLSSFDEGDLVFRMNVASTGGDVTHG